jgi:hypothetical protein
MSLVIHNCDFVENFPDDIFVHIIFIKEVENYIRETNQTGITKIYDVIEKYRFPVPDDEYLSILDYSNQNLQYKKIPKIPSLRTIIRTYNSNEILNIKVENFKYFVPSLLKIFKNQKTRQNVNEIFSEINHQKLISTIEQVKTDSLLKKENFTNIFNKLFYINQQNSSNTLSQIKSILKSSLSETKKFIILFIKIFILQIIPTGILFLTVFGSSNSDGNKFYTNTLQQYESGNKTYGQFVGSLTSYLLNNSATVLNKKIKQRFLSPYHEALGISPNSNVNDETFYPLSNETNINIVEEAYQNFTQYFGNSQGTKKSNSNNNNKNNNKQQKNQQKNSTLSKNNRSNNIPNEILIQLDKLTEDEIKKLSREEIQKYLEIFEKYPAYKISLSIAKSEKSKDQKKN